MATSRLSCHSTSNAQRLGFHHLAHQTSFDSTSNGVSQSSDHPWSSNLSRCSSSSSLRSSCLSESSTSLFDRNVLYEEEDGCLDFVEDSPPPPYSPPSDPSFYFQQPAWVEDEDEQDDDLESNSDLEEEIILSVIRRRRIERRRRRSERLKVNNRTDNCQFVSYSSLL
jgi:hypothetical protein